MTTITSPSPYPTIIDLWDNARAFLILKIIYVYERPMLMNELSKITMGNYETVRKHCFILSNWGFVIRNHGHSGWALTSKAIYFLENSPYMMMLSFLPDPENALHASALGMLSQPTSANYQQELISDFEDQWPPCLQMPENPPQIPLNFHENQVNIPNTPFNFAVNSVNLPENRLNFAEKPLNSAEKQLNIAEKPLNSAKNQLNSAEKPLNSAKNQLNSAEKPLNSAKNQLNIAEKPLNSAKNQLNIAEKPLNSAKNQLNPAKNQLNSAENAVTTTTTTKINNSGFKEVVVNSVKNTEKSKNHPPIRAPIIDDTLPNQPQHLDTNQKSAFGLNNLCWQRLLAMDKSALDLLTKSPIRSP